MKRVEAELTRYPVTFRVTGPGVDTTASKQGTAWGIAMDLARNGYTPVHVREQ